ncbi:hypothetical protein EYZ11_003336 [Aspergillus tanneri]|uniref:Uncharacterized protein n=1 Tax=Aspergillus tanneri TaxID=1220188 RepID=A0A4S3JTL6_9EURO|nr:hypothetical protein EYZ11_003336 [Aspergillus tanneri]
MASPEDTSIEDVLDDLQLNHVILESLNEERPDAVAEIQEIRDTIKGLEARLTQLRGHPSGSQQSHPPSSYQTTSNTSVARAQLDGGSEPLTAARLSGQSDMSPPPRPSRLVQRSESPPYMTTAFTRKRQHYYGDDSETDFTDDLEFPAKRVRTNQLSESSSPGVRSSGNVSTDGLEEGLGDANDELQKILGLDSRDTLLALQDEQRMAEQWLEERKEQERRDAEFARTLMDGAQAPHRPSSAWSSSTHYSGTCIPFPASSQASREGQRNTHRFPGNTSSAQTTTAARPVFGEPSFPARAEPAYIIQDSDDSDIAEITANDFRRHARPGHSNHFTGGREYSQYQDLLSDIYEQADDPKKVNQEIKQLIESIRPDSDISKENREGTPEALRFALMEHQKLGLSWMKSLEEQDQKGGILADDMGLGKTVQAIALIVSRPSMDPERKPTLVIAPVALMQQWKREIQRILRPGKYQLTVYVLHGDKRSVGFRDLKNYDVVLTTFGTLSSELKRKERYDELQKSGANEPTLSRELLKSLPCLGPTSKWHRVIIDEAQCIKNRNTKAAIACCRLNSTYRWCMSGTPMMNSVEELHSLLRFLRIRPYSSLERFNHSGSASAQDKAMTQLQVLLKAVLLRRTKESKIDGKPILQLPPRISEKVHAVFSEDEQELYSALEAQTQLQFNRYLEAGTVGRNYSNILVLLLRLRQACCHPHLIKDYGVKLNANTDEFDMIANAKAFGKEVVIRLKDNNELECPICIDAVDNPIIFFPCGHSTCAECFSRISDPALSVQQGHDGSVEVKCPNCRAKIDPKKVTDHLSFKKVHFPGTSDDSAELEAPDPIEEEEGDSDESDQESLSRFIVNDGEDEGPSKSSKRKEKGKMPQRSKKTLAELKKEASKNQKSKRKYLRRLEKTWMSSAKIDKAMEILANIQDGESNEKTIIFSQFTSLLDLLEVPIMRRGWGYRRYDGSMRPADRNTAVLDFTDNPDCRIMLVSLKAGNAGLNLVAASQVIIFDPFWNPYIEEQAIDRAHRIGQVRQVQIHRILVEQTVEDRILELQDKKRELIEGALDEKASSNVSRLGTRETNFIA